MTTKYVSTAKAPSDKCRAAFDAGAMIDANERILANAVDVARHLLDRMTAINHDWAGFIDRRLRADIEAAQSLAACQTPPETLTVYAAFMQDAARQYADQLGRLAELMTDATAETWAEAREDLDEAVEACAPASFERA